MNRLFNFLNNKLPPPLFYILSFWMVVLFLYLPAYKAGMFLDFADMIFLYKQQNFWDFVNLKDNPNMSLYQVTQVLLYILISFFGTKPLGWFIVFTFLHALNGYLIFRFFKYLYEILSLKNTTWP